MAIMEDLITTLNRSPLFRGIDESKIKSIRDVCVAVEFSEGSFLLEHGKPAKEVYLITGGVVSLEITRKFRTAVIETLHTNEILGLSWINTPVEWTFDARAVKKVRALRIPAEFLLNMCESDYKSGYIMMRNLAKIISERLHASRVLLLDIYSGSPGTQEGV